MIHYVVVGPHSYTLGILLEHYCKSLSEHVRLIDYDSFFRLPALRGGAVIFTDFDRLSADALARAAKYHDYLSREGSPIHVLNDPRKSLQRFDLLRRLHDIGVNKFNVYRLDEDLSACRFPVFIRKERDHFNVLTQLIGNSADLAGAIRYCRARESDPADLMVVEFVEGKGPDGRFRKYGAYRVGDVLYAQHCFIRDEWHIKRPPELLSDADRQEHRAYIAANPHEAELRRIFELAHIDYGRLDYCVVGGKLQVFEINTNPTVLNGPPSALAYDTSPYSGRHEEAMRTLLGWGNADAVINIPPELRARRRSVRRAFTGMSKKATRRFAGILGAVVRTVSGDGARIREGRR